MDAIDCNTCGNTGRWETTLEDAPTTLVDLGPCPDCSKLTVWQAVPTKELTRIADELSEIADVTEGVLHASLSEALGNQVIMLRYHAEQAESYNEAAAEQAKIDRNLASLSRDI